MVGLMMTEKLPEFREAVDTNHIRRIVLVVWKPEFNYLSLIFLALLSLLVVFR